MLTQVKSGARDTKRSAYEFGERKDRVFEIIQLTIRSVACDITLV